MNKSSKDLADKLFPEDKTIEETAVIDIPPEKRRLHTETYDFSVGTINDYLIKDHIFIPKFQRSYVWTRSQASRLIESLIITDKKYPSIKNISAICKRFGVKDIFNAMSVIGKKDYKLIINSFNDVRTEIAHQHPSPDLGISSVVDNLKALLEVVDKLNRVLYSHIRKTSGEDCWLYNSIALPL